MSSKLSLSLYIYEYCFDWNFLLIFNHLPSLAKIFFVLDRSKCVENLCLGDVNIHTLDTSVLDVSNCS